MQTESWTTIKPVENYYTKLRILNSKIKIIAQEDIVPKKLQNYLSRHGEIRKKLSKNKKFEILVTKSNERYEKLSGEWFGKKVKPKLINF